MSMRTLVNSEESMFNYTKTICVIPLTNIFFVIHTDLEISTLAITLAQ